MYLAISFNGTCLKSHFSLFSTFSYLWCAVIQCIPSSLSILCMRDFSRWKIVSLQKLKDSHFKSSVLFHSPYLTVCIRFYAVTGFVFWIVQEKRIYECPVIHKPCIYKPTFGIRKADVQDSFFQVIEMFHQFIFSNQIMSFLQMKRFEILFKILFFLLCETDVFLKPHLLDGLINKSSYLCRCHKFM